MKRRILLVVLGLLLLAAGSWIAFTLYWHGRYEAEIERIRAAGHPVLPADVVVPDCPDDENMLPVLQLAASRHTALTSRYGHIELYKLEFYDPEDEGPAVTEEEARAALAVLPRYFALIDEALERPRLVVGPGRRNRRACGTDLVECIRARSCLRPHSAVGGARRLFQLAAAMEPTTLEQTKLRREMVAAGLERLRLGLARGETVDPRLVTALARLDPIGNVRWTVLFLRAGSVEVIEDLRAGKEAFPGFGDIRNVLERMGYDPPALVPTDFLHHRLVRPLVLRWAAKELKRRTDAIERLESERRVLPRWGWGLYRDRYEQAVRQLAEIRIARFAVDIARDGVPSAELPVDPFTGESIECVRTPDGYRIGDDWFVPSRP